jgi:exonuclease 1
MLLDFGITPYLVFDGDSLPSKAETNAQRRKKREESKAAGLELLRAGKTAQAHQELQKAAAVIPSMAKLLIEQLKVMNVQYLVAPYEADAQLVYLEQKGIINGILSEDSDMLVYGAKRLITKLNQYAECVEIERADFSLCKEVSLTGWTDAMFRRMAILSGCDYLPNIDKMGLKTAYRFVRKYKDAEKVLRMVQFEGKLSVPADYLIRFQHAELTFIHHRIFCPQSRRMVFMEELQRGAKEEDMPFLGEYVDPDTAIGVACGDLNPKTKKPFDVRPAARPALRENRRQTLGTPQDLKPNKSIQSFLITRQPLAELDPNSLTPSPSQQRLLERNRNATWEPRLVSSAPQMRTSTAVTESSSSIRTNRDNFLSRASAVSAYQAPKRQRLCSDTQDPSPSKEVKHSPFFAASAAQGSPSVQKKARMRKAQRGAFDVWSDDAVDDILLGLPDVQQVASPPKVQTHAIQADEDDAKEPSDVHSLIPQSSPVPGAVEYPTLDDDSSFELDDAAREDLQPLVENDDVKPFEDILESHIRMQRELKTFAYQSASSREAALRSLSPRKTHQTSKQTFVAQSPEMQRAALASLPAAGSIQEVCTHIQGQSTAQQSTTSPPPVPAVPTAVEQSLDNWSSTADEVRLSMSPFRPLNGSEDALVPNSEDEACIEGDETPTFDLRAYAFIPV